MPRREIAALRQRPRTTERAVIIGRVSSESQAENTSFATQLAESERFCRLRNLTVVDRLEEAVSGTLYFSREALQSAVAMIEANQADVIVVYDMTRYGRDEEFQHKFLKRIIHAGGQLQFTTWPLQYDPLSGELTVESRMMFTVLGGNSAVERATFRRRVQNGIERSINNGMQIYRTFSPFGWVVVDDFLIKSKQYEHKDLGFYFPVPDELKIVREMIFEPYQRGLSLARVADGLNKVGILTRNSKEWSATAVSRIIHHPIYMGKPVCKRREFSTIDERGINGKLRQRCIVKPESEWRYIESEAITAHFARPDIAPLLVTEKLWRECQERTVTNKQNLSGRDDRKYPLTGLLRCPHCNRSLCGKVLYPRIKGADGVKVIDKEQEPSVRYACTRRDDYRRPSDFACIGMSWHGPFLTEMVYAGLEAYLCQPQILNMAVKEAQRREAAKAKGGSGNTIKEKIANLKRRERAVAESRVEARIAGGDASVFDPMLADIFIQRSALELQLKTESSFTVELPPTPAGIPDVLPLLKSQDVDNLTKNRLLRSVIEAVAIIPQSPGVKPASYPAGVKIRFLGFPESLGSLVVTREKPMKIYFELPEVKH